MFIGIITEACEAIEQTSWKKNWKQSATYNEQAFREEIIDLWHFVINLTLSADMTADDVFRMYTNKHHINLKRQEDKY